MKQCRELKEELGILLISMFFRFCNMALQRLYNLIDSMVFVILEKVLKRILHRIM